MTVDAHRAVDPIARLAEAWDGTGRNAFHISGREHRALLVMAQLPEHLANVRWETLSPDERYRVVQAVNFALELGRACAWVFGEGRGA